MLLAQKIELFIPTKMCMVHDSETQRARKLGELFIGHWSLFPMWSLHFSFPLCNLWSNYQMPWRQKRALIPSWDSKRTRKCTVSSQCCFKAGTQNGLCLFLIWYLNFCLTVHHGALDLSQWPCEDYVSLTSLEHRGKACASCIHLNLAEPNSYEILTSHVI